MSWPVLIKALYTNLVGQAGAVSGHTYDTLPDNDDTTVTPSTTADTFGNYAQIISTVGAAKVWITGVHATPSANTDYKAEIGTGLSGSETARVTVPFRGTTATFIGIPFPVGVPSGTRLASRAKQGATAANTIDVVVLVATGLS